MGHPTGRDNYYGTAILYIVGQGVVPWEAQGALHDSFPMPVAGWLGGNTTLPYQYSDEPDNHFIQMAPNLSNINGQVFVLGRRVHHTDFGDGSHNEAVTNPDFTELANRWGHTMSTAPASPAMRKMAGHCRRRQDSPGPVRGQESAMPAATRIRLVGAVLQPQSTSGAAEGSVSISSWNESNGLRWPNFSFSGAAPANFSARIAPQLVGMGLLEAITEADIEALADPDDSDGDGISGRMRW